MEHGLVMTQHVKVSTNTFSPYRKLHWVLIIQEPSDQNTMKWGLPGLMGLPQLLFALLTLQPPLESRYLHCCSDWWISPTNNLTWLLSTHTLYLFKCSLHMWFIVWSTQWRGVHYWVWSGGHSNVCMQEKLHASGKQHESLSEKWTVVRHCANLPGWAALHSILMESTVTFESILNLQAWHVQDWLVQIMDW